jgi:hypothetical protein
MWWWLLQRIFVFHIFSSFCLPGDWRHGPGEQASPCREQLGSRSAQAAVRQLLPSIFEQLFWVQLFREDSPKMISQPIALYLKSKNRGRKNVRKLGAYKDVHTVHMDGWELEHRNKYSKLFKGTVLRDFSWFFSWVIFPQTVLRNRNRRNHNFCRSETGTVIKLWTYAKTKP